MVGRPAEALVRCDARRYMEGFVHGSWDRLVRRGAGALGRAGDVTDYRDTRFWVEAFDPRSEPPALADHRRALASAYETFRDNAALLASEISRDLPSFTQHDATHL